MIQRVTEGLFQLIAVPLQVVGQLRQTQRDMFVPNDDSLGDRELRGREVPDCLDPGSNQTVGQLLGCSNRSGQNGATQLQVTG